MSQGSSTHITSLEFGQLFERYKPQFVIVARSYVRDIMIAEDLVTDCFISFWENREKIEAVQSIPSYILISVKRRCLNWLRDQSVHLRVHEDIHSSALRLISSRIVTLEATDPNNLFLEEISAIIKRELANMPEQTRRIFLASRFGEKTYNEIGEKFGLSFNQVSFEIRKATQILRLALKDYLPALILVYLSRVFL
ncbi:RNA polymerase sigma-70 factor (ECF subfamily) [Dysgonomonas hofstadii]|uniref:RNA polymerase sigma-70 factor (ECF subfamily) n=1 Tax=Dysgonomonas hofstadii TaxID=637886 RepID=A0A840CNS2_9BACT|nr:RNA polymerase sigma-70 factor [Dysgonomonas hofstadii]MBB4037747.1 RNA polymerase sigma-70 factor (ECF subfamily) [Dysgonomonas hofstadii]